MTGRKRAADLERWLVAVSGGSTVFTRSWLLNCVPSVKKC